MTIARLFVIKLNCHFFIISGMWKVIICIDIYCEFSHNLLLLYSDELKE